MKKLVILATLILLPLSAISQTESIDESRAAHNAAACALGSLPANCSDAQLGVALPGARGMDATVYATNASYRDAVIVAPRLRERLAERRSRVLERLVDQPAKCVAILTAAELPTDVCK